MSCVLALRGVAFQRIALLLQRHRSDRSLFVIRASSVRCDFFVGTCRRVLGHRSPLPQAGLGFPACLGGRAKCLALCSPKVATLP
jgi:hypothetical protein